MNKEEKISLQQRRALDKAMTFKDYIGLGVGCIIGVGWVIVAGNWLTRGGPLGVILGYLLGGLMLMAVGICYAELTPAMPVAGGEVAFTFKAFGAGLSFMTGWFLSFAYIAICPFAAVAIGGLAESFVPGLKSKTLYIVAGYPVSVLSVSVGVVLSLFIIVLNYRGVKFSARFQTISTALMLACAVVFVLVAFIKGSFSNLSPLFAGEGTLWSALRSTIAVLGIVPFFMSGFDTIPQLAEESGKKLDPNHLGRAVIISIITGALFYAIVILALSLCMPWKEAIKLDMPTANVFRVAFNYEWAAKLVLFTAFLGLITSINGFFLASTRVIFAMGRGGLLPRYFGEIDEKYHTPKNAIIFVGFMTLIGPFVGRSSLNPLVNVGSLAFISGWFMTCLSSVRLRKSAPEMNRPYKAKHKIILYLGGIISGVLILLMILPGSSAQLAWPFEYIILGVWMFMGYIAYRWRKAARDIDHNERAYYILGDYR